MKQSVLEYVREHVHDGRQDRDFSLDEFRTTPMEIPFTDGAMDGICFFHSQQKADPEVCDFLQERMDITDREQMLKYFGEIEEFFSFLFQVEFLYKLH
ncbi:MAG: hypothetical protein IJI05_06190, partial [Erysipelotrichaceae bacterium]|nr:hypothetical protein [Erysipelotrichaceae bacterium]